MTSALTLDRPWFALDAAWLEDVGLARLSAATTDQLLTYVYSQLELRVGSRLAERMTDGQLDELESFIDGNDQTGAFAWLESRFPDYPQVVYEEFRVLTGTVKAGAERLLAALADEDLA